MTNVRNVHTLSTGSMNLFVAGVAVSNNKLFQFPGDMIGRTGVKIPIGIYTV